MRFSSWKSVRITSHRKNDLENLVFAQTYPSVYFSLLLNRTREQHVLYTSWVLEPEDSPKNVKELAVHSTCSRAKLSASLLELFINSLLLASA